MAVEIPVEPRLENLAKLSARMDEYAKSQGIKPPRRRELLRALALAFSAACLIGDPRRAAVFSLERKDGELRLGMRFGGPPGEAPPGLASALFCPPARRTIYSHDDGRAAWAAFWEDI